MASPPAMRLALKPGANLLVLGAPRDYRHAFGELPEGSRVTRATRGTRWRVERFDGIQVFVRDRAAVKRWTPAVLASLEPGGVLWYAYPKQSSGVETDINRDRGWDTLSDAGWRPVSQISLDDTWSALRFRLAAGWNNIGPDLRLACVRAVTALERDPTLDYLALRHIVEGLDVALATAGGRHLRGRDVASAMIESNVLSYDHNEMWYDSFTERMLTVRTFKLNEEDESVAQVRRSDSNQSEEA